MALADLLHRNPADPPINLSYRQVATFWQRMSLLIKFWIDAYQGKMQEVELSELPLRI